MNILLFIYRLFIHLAILLLISIPLQLLSLIIVPVVLLFIAQDPKFPSALKWFDNADVWLNRDTSTYLAVINQGFLYRYYWLTIRNPLNYFGYAVLGFQVDEPYLIMDEIGDPEVGDGASNKPGFFYQEIQLKNNKTYYEYYYILKYNQTHCLRFRLGWKIGTNNLQGQYVEQCLIFQPYKSYSGV